MKDRNAKLEIIGAGHYFVEGSHGISETGISLSLQAHVSVEVTPNAVVIEGSWQQYSGRPTYALRVQLLRDQISQSQADVRIAGSSVIEMKGRASLSGLSVDFRARLTHRCHRETDPLLRHQHID